MYRLRPLGIYFSLIFHGARNLTEIFRNSMNIKVHFPKPEELSPVFNIETKNLAEEYSTMSIPKPVTTFEQAYKNYPEILGEVAKQGFSEPTPIQCQLWPCIMKGHDVVGIAQTGSGNRTIILILPHTQLYFCRQNFGVFAASFHPH
jgi:hypothetical protein